MNRLGRAVTRWVCLTGFTLSALFAQEPARPDLKGRVFTEDDKPLKDATVFIYTAEPKTGPGVLCPSCYADCAKRAKSDAEGRFTIASLDPKLLFRVLIVAKGREPEFIDKVDPASEPIEAYLPERTLPDDPQLRVLGRVINDKGQPVEGAVISIRSVTREGRTQYGGNRDVDPMAVSDEKGEFFISSSSPIDAMGLEVEARSLAKGIFANIRADGERHELKLREGVMIKGRVLAGAEPLPGVQIGISGAERWSEVYVGNWSVATDDEGKFLFSNLPAKTAYQLYGKMESLSKHGAIASRALRAEEDGTILDVGDLKVEPAFRLEGRVVLSDGREIPEGTKLNLGRDNAWDSYQIEVDDTGQFAFEGVPAEVVSLSTRVRGYRPSIRNGSLDPLNPYHLVGIMRANKTNLMFELEPGRNLERLDGDQQALREEPLQGAEPPDEFPDGIQVSGTVLDDKTGKPLEKFTVTQGREALHDRGMAWFSTRKREYQDGKFTLSFQKQQHAPGVLIEAEGCLPQAFGPIRDGSTNLVVRMVKGGGISGAILKPGGEPAADVTVYLTDNSRNGVYVNERLEVQERIYEGTRKTNTDEEGKFSFQPQIDAYSVIVFDEAGFANVRVSELQKKPEVRLQPWAKVEGKLLIGSKPGTNESIRLWPAHVPYADHPRPFPALNIYLNTKSDENGEFEFPRVPPLAVEIYHEPKVRESRMGTIAVAQNSKFILQPGEARKITIGGKGRPIIGKILVEGYTNKIDWRADVHSIELNVPEPDDLPNFRKVSASYAEEFRKATTDEERKALQEKMRKEQEANAEKTRLFYQTDAGREYHFARRKYALNFAQDGSFRIEDVPPGKYTMNIDLREGSGNSPSRFSAPRIATLNKEFEVPPMTGDRTDEPLDLGTMTVQSQARRQ